jgi:hypothetical protein
MPVGRDSLEGYLPFASRLTQSGAENSEMPILKEPLTPRE